MIIELIQLASSFSLGLLVGSLLTEALILLPYWRAIDPEEFLNLHGSLGPRLYRYFAPLTILATVLPLLAAITSVIFGTAFFNLSIAPAIIILVMLFIYIIYFKGANESFKTGSVGADGVSEELRRWAKWHWVRVYLGLVAFFISLLILQL
jgi:hypothetical protein